MTVLEYKQDTPEARKHLRRILPFLDASKRFDRGDEIPIHEVRKTE